MMLEQWFSALQLLFEDLWEGLMGQVSTLNRLTCMWKREMRRRDNIIEGGGNETKGSEKSREKHCGNLEPTL